MSPFLAVPFTFLHTYKHFPVACFLVLATTGISRQSTTSLIARSIDRFFREGIHCRYKHGTVIEVNEEFYYETADREPRFTLMVELDNDVTVQGRGFEFYRDRDSEQKFRQGDRVIVKYDTRTNEVKQVRKKRQDVKRNSNKQN